MEYEGMGRNKDRVGFGEVVLGRVGYGSLGWVFDFSIGFTFKRQIKYLPK